MPTVTIIVPSYNHLKFFPRTLGAVRGQTFTDWNMVVVDDGSTDGSLELLAGLNDPRIKFHKNDQNLGTYGTLNRALDLANGEFVAVLNSDDIWAPTKLEKQFELIGRHPSSVVCYTAPALIDDDGEPVVDRNHHEDWPTDEIHALISRELWTNRVLASSAVFRRDLLRFDAAYRYSGDWLAMLEAAAAGQFAFVNEPLTSWRIHAANAHKQNMGVFVEEIAVRQSIMDAGRHWFRSHEEAAVIREALASNAIRLNTFYILAGDKDRATKALENAVTLGYGNPTIEKRLKFNFLPLSIQRMRLCRGTDPAPHEAAYHGGIPQIHKFAC